MNEHDVGSLGIDYDDLEKGMGLEIEYLILTWAFISVWISNCKYIYFFYRKRGFEKCREALESKGLCLWASVLEKLDFDLWANGYILIHLYICIYI